MAILVEALTVIVRKSLIDKKLPGGYSTFCEMIGTRAVCTDGQLVGGALFSPDEVEQFVTELTRFDIHYIYDDEAESPDVAVVDQRYGPMCKARWLDWGYVKLDGIGSVAAAAAAGSSLTPVACPDGWRYDLSLSSEYGFIPSDEKGRLLPIERNAGVDSYVDLKSGSMFHKPTPRDPTTIIPSSVTPPNTAK